MTVALRLAFAGVAALVAAIAAWSVAAPPPDAERHRETIANMSEADRDRLHRKYEAYRRLSTAEKHSIQQLHEAVETDKSLARTLDDYESFLSRLDPLQQTELRQSESLEQRMERIESHIAAGSRPDPPGRPGWLMGQIEGTTFLPSQFDRAMQIVAEAFDVPESEMDRSPPHVRHLVIARHVAAKVRSNASAASRFDDGAIDRIAAQLPTSRPKEWLTSDDWPLENRRTLLLGLLTRSLLAEWQSVAAHEVDREELRAAFEKLPESRQVEEARDRPDELFREVILKVLDGDDRHKEFAKDFREVIALREQFDRWDGRRMLFMRDRSGGRGPGSDRHDDDRHDDRRGEDRDGRRGDDRRD